MMVHMTTNKGPWDFGDQALDIYRTFARLHTRLYPYTDSAANDVCNRGMPIIRPLALAFPDDSTACEQRFEYLFGPDLLVAPMFQGGTRRSVYLPRGRWIDFWSGELHDGPRTIEAEAPLERMPLYVREGAVVPMLPANVDTLLRRTDDVDPAVRCLDDRRVLEVWPGTGGGAGETVLRDGLRAELRNDAGLHVLRITPGIARDLEVRLRYLSPATRIDHTAGAQASLEKLKDSVLLRVPDAQAEFTVSWE
jgi:alpha-D-xyloside xylohydrolase